MVFRLRKELIEFCALKTDSPKYLELFENLGEIRARGFHFVIPDRELLDCLRNHQKLSVRTRKVFQQVYNKYTSQSAILNSVDFVVSVSNYRKPNLISGGIEMPLSLFDGNSFLAKNRLLLENSSDSKLYEMILEFYRKNQSYAGVNHQWDVNNGGGSTTYAEYERITKESDNYVFCILDSDQNSPKDSLGATALEFYNSEYQTAFGEYTILPVHEMENLLPFESFNAMVHGNPIYRSQCKVFEKISNNKTSELRKYIDFKTGISQFKLNQMQAPSKYFWEEQLKEHDISYANCGCDGASCSHFIIKPIGRDAMKKVFDFAKKINLTFSGLLTDLEKTIWMQIGKTLFDRFCSPDFMRNLR